MDIIIRSKTLVPVLRVYCQKQFHELRIEQGKVLFEKERETDK